jgi:septal ring factor EnvC (AmiA/AmiB activator)
MVTEALTRKTPSGTVRRMKKLSAIPVVLALALVVAAPVSAATPNTVLKSQLRAQKAKVAKLKSQLADAKSTITTLNGQVVTLTTTFAQAQADLATRTAERDAANTSLAAQTALTGQAAAGAITGLSPDQLWGVIGAIYAAFPNASGCGFSKSYYASAPYFNYSFTSYGC